MNLSAFLPETIMLVGGCLVLLVSVFKMPFKRFVLGLLGIATAVIALIVLLSLDPVSHPAGNLFLQDGFSNFARALLLIITVPIFVSSFDMFSEISKRQGQFVFLVLISVGGLMLLVQSTHMLSLYLAIEMSSIPLYLMAGLRLGDVKAKEAVVKYFLLGAFASAVIIYGFSLMFNTTGTLAFSELSKRIIGTPLEYLGIVMLIAGLAFKVAAVPFHFWAPDVYEGAPSISVAFISVAPKIGALVVLSRFVVMAINPIIAPAVWPLLAAISALSMTFGNLSALWQTEVKRIMAYSSIAQIGYMLIAVVVMAFDPTIKEKAAEGMLMYVTAYALMNIAVFSIIKVIRNKYGGSTLSHFRGLSKTNPSLALAMLISLVSLLGVPFAAGFFGKLLVFTSGVSAGLYWLVVLAVINSGISAFYYFGIVKTMYLEQPDSEIAPATTEARSVGFAEAVGYVCALGTLVLGLVPWMYEALLWASKSLSGG